MSPVDKRISKPHHGVGPPRLSGRSDRKPVSQIDQATPVGLRDVTAQRHSRALELVNEQPQAVQRVRLVRGEPMA